MGGTGCWQCVSALGGFLCGHGRCPLGGQGALWGCCHHVLRFRVVLWGTWAPCSLFWGCWWAKPCSGRPSFIPQFDLGVALPPSRPPPAPRGPCVGLGPPAVPGGCWGGPGGCCWHPDPGRAPLPCPGGSARAPGGASGPRWARAGGGAEGFPAFGNCPERLRAAGAALIPRCSPREP